MKFRIFTLTSLALIISSCGGGGGGSSSDNTPSVSLPIINSFSSNLSSINTNDSITLSWSSSNTTSCNASGDLNEWQGSLPTNGSKDITLTTSGTFVLVLTCSNINGRTDSKNISIQVISDNISNPKITVFTLSSNSITVNNSITVTWSSENTSICFASGNLNSWQGSVNTNDSINISMTSIGRYDLILTCSNEDQTISDQKTLSLEVTESDTPTDPYVVDKDSYCKLPSNNNGSPNYWIEEFNNNKLDTNVFSYQVGNGFFSGGQWVPGWGNEEEQYYTSCQATYSKQCNNSNHTTENTFIEDGFLKIQPIYWNPNYPSSTNGQAPFLDPYNQKPFLYTSGKLVTSDKKTIDPGSEVTVCFKVPEGSGHWPAFWMMPQGFENDEKYWPRDGEIDVMEHMYSNQDNQIQSTVHYGNTYEDHAYTYGIETIPQNVNFVDKFHSITFKWVNNKLEFYLDTHDEPFHSLDRSTSKAFMNDSTYWPFNESFYLIMNVAVGGTNGGYINHSKYCQDVECSNLSDPDMGRLLIDYIEVKSIN